MPVIVKIILWMVFGAIGSAIITFQITRESDRLKFNDLIMAFFCTIFGPCTVVVGVGYVVVDQIESYFKAHPFKGIKNPLYWPRKGK